MSPSLVVIGNPECRRVTLWKAAAARLGWKLVATTYTDFLEGRFSPIPRGSVVRFETPSGDWDTFKRLLRLGQEPALREGYPALDGRSIDRLEYERGWLIRPRQAHLGYQRLLRMLELHLRSSGASFMHTADEIAVCFDKPLCQERLEQSDVPIPRRLGAPSSYDELRPAIQDHGRVMVKLAHGSGAAGCVAIHAAGGRMRGLTTVAQKHCFLDGWRMYVSKQPIPLDGETAVAALIDRLCVEHVQVEEWLPKAHWQGRNIDLRIVVIGGTARHAVARSSNSVFTNLTLGGRHDDLPAIVQRMGPEAWQRVRDTCESAAAAFPQSFTLGIDVLVRSDWQRHSVLEVNAFGDLLVGELDRGEDTYTATLNAWQRLAREQPSR